ncbi:MAG: HPr family phosphocarrier protein [Gammaproteobacteria bacterium]|nr:HPr family phosphocarrier protein [Gammaproteobacteria bacterium]
MQPREITTQLQVINRLGLHARAAAKLVNLCKQFESRITISRNQRQVNGKSIMGVMMLAATCGSSIGVEIIGPDAADLLDALQRLLDNRFGEGE